MNAHLVEINDQKLQRCVFLGRPVGKQIFLTTESELMDSNSSEVLDLGLSDVRRFSDDLHLIFNGQLQGLMRFFDVLRKRPFEVGLHDLNMPQL